MEPQGKTLMEVLGDPADKVPTHTPAGSFADPNDFEYSRTERRPDGFTAIYAVRKSTPQVGEILHCANGPAIIEPDGTQKFFYGGLLHRENGPAILSADGRTQKFYIGGRLHREGGPAIIDPIIGEYWYTRGVLHRSWKAPAVTHANGDTEYWVHGAKVYPKVLDDILLALGESPSPA